MDEIPVSQSDNDLIDLIDWMRYEDDEEEDKMNEEELKEIEKERSDIMEATFEHQMENDKYSDDEEEEEEEEYLEDAESDFDDIDQLDGHNDVKSIKISKLIFYCRKNLN